MKQPRSTYDDVIDGVPFLLENEQPLHLVCCSCGLAHVFAFTKVRGGIEIQIVRNDRITGQMRRHNKFPCR